jgi:hypothetical protein
LPLPLAPLVTVSHDVSLLTPAHEQPDGALTLVAAVVLAAPMEVFGGVNVIVHVAAA